MPAPPPESSFEALFRAHRAAVLRFAQRRLDDEASAWEVVSETFLTAWRIRERQPPEASLVTAWLYAIAGNAVRNQRRSRVRAARLAVHVAAARSTPGSVSAVDADPADEVVNRHRLREAMEQLSEDDQELLRLVAWEGLDTAGLGAALMIEPSTAKVRLHRARRRLRAALESGDAFPLAATAAPTTPRRSP